MNTKKEQKHGDISFDAVQVRRMENSWHGTHKPPHEVEPGGAAPSATLLKHDYAGKGCGHANKISCVLVGQGRISTDDETSDRGSCL